MRVLEKYIVVVEVVQRFDKGIGDISKILKDIVEMLKDLI